MTISSTEGSKEPAANFPAAAVDDEVDAATSNSTDANTPKSSKHHLQAEGDEGKEEQRKETEPDTKAESQETGDDDQNNSSVGENRSQSDITSSDNYHKDGSPADPAVTSQTGNLQSLTDREAPQQQHNQQNHQQQKEADQEEKEITVPSTANTRAATRRLKLPKACFCPISNYTKIMEDPVVHPDGESYEKVAISKQDPDAICYPNRALKAFIERELERSNTNGSNWESLLQNVALPFTERNPLPESFICPISFDFMFEPVIDKDGYTYEQEALISWIKVNADSPVTRQPLTTDDLYKNKAILRIMLELTDFEEELIPSPLLRWKEELNNRPHAADPLEFEMTTVTQIPSDENNESPPRYSNNRRYPTTREELNAIRRHNAQVVIFCVLIAAVFSFVLYVFSPRYFLFLLIIGTVLYSFKIAQSRRRVRQRADSTSRDS